MKKWISLLLTLTMLLMVCMPAAAATNTLTMTSSSPITAGATLKNYTWDISDGKVKASVIEVDLTNPYVQLQIVPGKGLFTQRSTVTAMANRTDAIAMVNGDFFNMAAEGAPIGTTVMDGQLVSSQSYLTGVYCLGITKDRTAFIDEFSFSGSVVAATGEKRNLSGLNKPFYWEETTGLHSHIGRLHLYNDMWGGTKRGEDSYVGTPAEVIIKDNRITAVAMEGGFGTAVPKDCYILHGDGAAAEWMKTYLHQGDSIQLNYSYKPAKDWQMVIGGHALLANNGQTVPYTKDLSALAGIRARTAAGISKDGKKVYIVAVEGRTGDSAGITLGNLGLLMTKIGAWKAVNLDGGGSTAMVVRQLAETERTRVINPEKNGSERSVVEGLGVFSTAPEGQTKGIFINGSKTLLIGESATYSYKAYDTYYNPVKDVSGVTLSESTGLGVVDGNKFTATKAGKATLNATGGSGSGTQQVTIIGKDGLKAMNLTIDKKDFADGSTHQLKAKVTLKDGTVKDVNPTALQWSVEGFDGTIDANGRLTIGQLGDTETGVVKVSYDGFEANLALKFAEDDNVVLTIDSKTMLKNGEAQKMDVAPVIVNSRTMVPVRFIAEAFGGEVDWDDILRTAYISLQNSMVEVPVDSATIYVNGEAKTIDTPSQIISDRTMIPLRAVAEGLGLQVDYNDATRSITITQP